MLSLAGITSAQQGNGMLISKHDNDPHVTNSTQRPTTVSDDRATIIWSDDFSNPGNWTMNNTSAPTSYDWVITTNQGDIPNAAPELQPFASTSASNGFALINSDGQPGNADSDGAIVANIRFGSAIDCSGSPNVVLRFQHSYRWWHETRGVRVSGDNGATWTDFDITSDNGGTIANGYPNNQNSENPVQEAINISSVAGGQSQVLVEFYYNDNDFWAWYWVVDDVEIIEQPLDDVQMLSAWASGTNNDGIEYGRTPLTHIDSDYIIGAEVFNFGVNDQTGIVMDADYVSFTSQSTDVLVMSDSTIYPESTETPTLAIGLYTGDYIVVTDGETGGAEFADNSYQRIWEVTDNVYSLDGIGNHPAMYENLDRIGTGSFLDATDYLVIGCQYRIKTTDVVSGIRVMLDANTVEGGQITVSVKDTATFLADDMVSLFESQPMTITASHISAGYVDVFFDQEESINAGAYYACVMLESYGGSSDIYVVDDQTVAQPSTASMIYIENDASYTNGTASGVQMLMGSDWGVGVEDNTLTGISVYPNPSNGEFTITNDDNVNSDIVVYDMLGQIVYSSAMTAKATVDLSTLGAGTYVVKVSNDNGTYVENVVIK